MFRKKKDKNKDDSSKKKDKSKLPIAEQKVLNRQQERQERKLDSKIKAEKEKIQDSNVPPSTNPSFDPDRTQRKSGESQLTVALRVRPLHRNEEQRGFFEVAKKVDNKMVVLLDPQSNKTTDILRAKRSNEKQFVFDCAFDGTATQEEVYTKTTQKLIENVLNGYNGTVFAYGATGAGKTHTMVGADNDPGTMVRALNDMFNYMEKTKEQKKYQVTMSYMEIYNEMIRDLLCPSSGYLELRENSKGAHKVVGLSELPISNPKEVMELLMKGNKQRTQEPTAANKTSSRSHALLQVIIKKENRIRQDVNNEIKTGQLFMVDLAGSERAAQTQNSGKRLKEGAHINRSLLALGNCINALASAKGAKYVNFRDSKLTRLLKEPLSGNCRTVMIAHVSPASHHFDESRNTLLYADRAKNIKNKVTSNVNNVDFHVTQYKQIIAELRQEIQRLQDKLGTQPNTGDDFIDRPAMSRGEIQGLKEKFLLSFKTQMALRQQMMELDNIMLALSTEFDKLTIIIDQLEVEKAQKNLNGPNAKEGKEKKKKKKSKDKKNKQLKENDEEEDIKAAWEEIRFIQSEQSKYLQIREEVQQQFEECHDNIFKLEEELPSLISNNDQREIFILLCKVHELEIQKMEIQTETLIRQYELKKKELMIHRYDRQRELSEEIITKQRALIDVLNDSDSSKHKDKRTELLLLYNKYQQELEDMNTDRDTPTNTNKLRASSVMSMKQGTRSLSSQDLTNGGKLFSRRESLDKLPILSLEDRTTNRMRSDSIISVREQLGGSLPASPLTNSEYANKLPPIGNAVNGISTPPNQNDISGSVRNISALAARKRSNENEDNRNDKSEKSLKNKRAVASAKPGKERRNSGGSVFDTFSIIAEDDRKDNAKKLDKQRKGLKTAGMRRSNSTTTLKKYRPTSTTSRDIDQMLSFSLMH